MKRYLPFFLLFALFLAKSASLKAFDFSDKGQYYNVESKSRKTCRLTYLSKKYNDYSGDVVVDSVVHYEGEEYTVTAVEAQAFAGCSMLSSVTLPATIARIDKGAFAGCRHLNYIIMEAATPPLVVKGALDGIKVYVPNEAYSAYSADPLWHNVSLAPRSYTLRYVVDGTDYKTTIVPFLHPITIPKSPSKKGHTFGGWVGIPDDRRMPDHDVVINGSFEAKTYAASFVVDGAVLSTEQFAYGATIVYPDVEGQGAYDFAGWTDQPEHDKMPSHNIIVRGSYCLNASKAVAMAGLRADTLSQYRVVSGVQPLAKPSAGSSALRNGRRLDYLPKGSEVWNRPDELEMMQLRKDGWFRHVVDYGDRTVVSYIPADSVSLAARHAFTPFPVLMLDRGPVSYRNAKGDHLRIFRIDLNEHHLTNYDKTPFDTAHVEFVVEHKYRDKDDVLHYQYTFMGYLDHTTARIHRAGAFPLVLDHSFVTHEHPLFDSRGRLMDDAQIEITAYNRTAFFLPADNVLLVFTPEAPHSPQRYDYVP